MKSAAEQEKTRERENYNLNASERLQAINAIQNPNQVYLKKSPRLRRIFARNHAARPGRNARIGDQPGR